MEVRFRREGGNAEPFGLAVWGEGVAERLVKLHSGLVVAVDLQSHPLRTTADRHAMEVLHELAGDATASLLGVNGDPKARNVKSLGPAAKHAVGDDPLAIHVLCHVVFVAVGEHGVAAGMVLGQCGGSLIGQRVRVEQTMVVVLTEGSKQRCQPFSIRQCEPPTLQRSVVAGGNEHGGEPSIRRPPENNWIQ